MCQRQEQNQHPRHWPKRTQGLLRKKSGQNHIQPDLRGLLQFHPGQDLVDRTPFGLGFEERSQKLGRGLSTHKGMKEARSANNIQPSTSAGPILFKVSAKPTHRDETTDLENEMRLVQSSIEDG